MPAFGADLSVTQVYTQSGSGDHRNNVTVTDGWYIAEVYAGSFRVNSPIPQNMTYGIGLNNPASDGIDVSQLIRLKAGTYEFRFDGKSSSATAKVYKIN